MEEKVRELVEVKQRSLAEENQKTLEVLKERYSSSTILLGLFSLYVIFVQVAVVRRISICNSSAYLSYFLVSYMKNLPCLGHMTFLCCPGGREGLLQDQLRHAQESVANIHKLHEIAQSKLFELRAQSGSILMQRHIMLFSLSLVSHHAIIVTNCSLHTFIFLGKVSIVQSCSL